MQSAHAGGRLNEEPQMQASPEKHEVTLTAGAPTTHTTLSISWERQQGT